MPVDLLDSLFSLPVDSSCHLETSATLEQRDASPEGQSRDSHE